MTPPHHMCRHIQEGVERPRKTNHGHSMRTTPHVTHNSSSPGLPGKSLTPRTGDTPAANTRKTPFQSTFNPRTRCGQSGPIHPHHTPRQARHSSAEHQPATRTAGGAPHPRRHPTRSGAPRETTGDVPQWPRWPVTVVTVNADTAHWRAFPRKRHTPERRAGTPRSQRHSEVPV